MRQSFVRNLTRAGLAAMAGTVLSGCPQDAHEITESGSEPSQDFPIATAYVEPVGSFGIDRFVLAGIDTAVSDAFSRTQSFVVNEQTGISFVSGCGLPPNNQCSGVEFPMVSSTVDTRLPALQDPDATALVGVTADSIFGIPLLVLSVAGLNPNTDYDVTLERLAVTADQGLDATNALLNNPALGGFQLVPDNPDALAPLGGSPGTSLGDNPYTIATITTDGAGSGFFAPGFAGSDAMFETNSQSPFDLPNYNHMVVKEAATGAPVLRAQFGVDLVASGADANNALAPFPAAALTAGQVLNSPGGAGRPDSINVTYNNLEELAGGAVYEAWLVNENTGATTSAVGTYNKFQIVLVRDSVTGEILSSTDSLVQTVPMTASFAGDASGDGFRHELIVSDGTLPGGAVDSVGLHTNMVLTLAGAPGGGAPAESRPLWFRYTDQNVTPDNFFDDSFITSGSTSFGNFDALDPDGSRIYAGSGQGTGGVREGILSADLQALSRPPVGYELVGWLMGVPATFAPVKADPITGPPPEFVQISDADVELIDGIVTEQGILNANLRLDGNEADVDYTKFGFFLVTLEPKLGIATMGPIPVQSGELPERVVSSPDE